MLGAWSARRGACVHKSDCPIQNCQAEVVAASEEILQQHAAIWTACCVGCSLDCLVQGEAVR